MIKDHPFADGNKRIGTLLFLEYLLRNRLLLKSNGEPRLADNAMVALALLVAESNPKQKELMMNLTLNLRRRAARLAVRAARARSVHASRHVANR